MQFLYPYMLWGLLALAIPIAVHLFNFRKHKLVYFSNTALLKTIQQENAKTRKLKYLVALCLRCLFIAALVLAFAFPFRPESRIETDVENNLIGIYLDNSMSMKTQSQRTTLFEDARESARDLVRRLNPSNRYVLMSNSFEVQNEYPMSQDEMLDQLERMNQEGSPVAMGEVLDRFAMLRKQHGFASSTLFVYSDFQRNTFDLSAAKADSSLQIVAVPMMPEFESNVYIDSVWLSSPIMQAGLTNEINVRVANEGKKEVKGLPISFMMDGHSVASATVDIEKNDEAEVTMQFLVEHSGDRKCTVSLVDQPIVFDDDYHFVFHVKPRLSVVEIGKEPSVSALLFDDDDQFDYMFMQPSGIDLHALSKAHFVIVNESAALNETMQQTLLDCAADGASVVLFPCSENQKNNVYFYEKTGLRLSEMDENPTAVENLAVQHEFFSDMILDMPQNADLPKVKKHVRLQPTVPTDVLLTLQNGDAMLLGEGLGKGQFYAFSTCLDTVWSDLADNSLFVPMLLKMALEGGKVGDIAYTLGKDKMLAINDMDVEGVQSFAMRNVENGFEMMPSAELHNNKISLYLNDDLPEAGFYELLQNDSVKSILAWNESRIESHMDFAGKLDVEKAFKQAGLNVAAVLDAADFATNDLVDAMAHQSSIWKWFVLMALLALLGEVLVLRLWK